MIILSFITTPLNLFLLEERLKPVSYTHLDVYKRQPLDQANALEGFVVSSALIGCILGASFAGWISQRYGRKPTLVLAAILFLLSAIGSAWPELFVGMPGSGDHTFMYLFVLYRIVGGVGVGLASMVSPMYIACLLYTSRCV